MTTNDPPASGTAPPKPRATEPCPGCGYEMVGRRVEPMVCPECGTVVPSTAQAAADRRAVLVGGLSLVFWGLPLLGAALAAGVPLRSILRQTVFWEVESRVGPAFAAIPAAMVAGGVVLLAFATTGGKNGARPGRAARSAAVAAALGVTAALAWLTAWVEPATRDVPVRTPAPPAFFELWWPTTAAWWTLGVGGAALAWTLLALLGRAGSDLGAVRLSRRCRAAAPLVGITMLTLLAAAAGSRALVRAQERNYSSQSVAGMTTQRSPGGGSSAAPPGPAMPTSRAVPAWFEGVAYTAASLAGFGAWVAAGALRARARVAAEARG